MFKFGLTNLRRLENIPPLELVPITVLVGRNSSGKSTFLRALPLLKQSVVTRTSAPILWYGDWVDFGDFRGAVIDNDVNNNISFSFSSNEVFQERDFFFEESGTYNIRNRKPLSIDTDICISKDQQGTRILSIVLYEHLNQVQYRIEVGAGSKIDAIYVNNTNMIDSMEDREVFLTPGSIFPNLFASTTRERKVMGGAVRTLVAFDSAARKKICDIVKNRLDKRTATETLDRLVRDLFSFDKITREDLCNLKFVHATKSWQKLLLEISTTDREKIYPRLHKFFLFGKLQNYLNSFSQHIKNIISSVLYIGPARAKNDRYYRYQDLAVSEIDSDGKNFPMFLNSLTSAEISNFSDWVEKYFNYGVSVARESGHISIELKHESNLVNIVDTGYGVSQILPVLGQVWWATNPRRVVRSRERAAAPIIAIEQPELHLHPAHQAMLADAFVSIFSDGSFTERGRDTPKFVIETHSEALINRLGALIAAQKIPPEHVQVVVFETDDNQDRRTTARKISFDQDGQLIDWPYGFFSPAV